MTTASRRALRTLVLRRLMPPALAAGVCIWAITAYFAHLDHIERLRETLHQRLELRAAVTAERLEAVAEAVGNAARNSITIGAMADQNVDRVVRPYLKSIAFADATAERVALLDYRARLIVADTDRDWTPPAGWEAAFENVSDGKFESLVENDRLVLAAPVVLGSYVEGTLVADISVKSLFVEVEEDFSAEVTVRNVTTPQFDLERAGAQWNGEVVWPVGDKSGLAIRLRKSIVGAGFWDNPVQTSLASVFALLIALTAAAIVLAARTVAAPVRQLVDDLAERGLEIGAPSPHAPAEIWTLTHRFVAAAADVEQALLRERELTAQQSQFVSMVSHEFRTPLAIIDGAAGALRRRRARMSDDAIAEKLNVISGAVTRLLRLMESTLTAARLDSDGFRIEPANIEISDLVARLVDERREISPGASVTVDLGDLPQTIIADERLITSVIDNLLSNAVKYGGDQPELCVRGWHEDGIAALAVSDNGVGIPEDQLDRIGERFFRATTSTGIIGTGVGLNMVKTVLDQHGGSLDVKSRIGEGSTFTIRLPVRPLENAAARRAADPIADARSKEARALWRLVYTSKAVYSLSDAALARLRSQSAKNNGKLGVTGALAYSDGRIAQVLEGPRDMLERLTERIRTDPRHTDFEIVAFEATHRRAYNEWRMNRIPASLKVEPLDALLRDIDLRAAA
ncbi:MAG: ATP-binding protein [Pseudomonadota bacterium]